MKKLTEYNFFLNYKYVLKYTKYFKMFRSKIILQGQKLFEFSIFLGFLRKTSEI